MTACAHGATYGAPRGDQWAVACATCGAILQVFDRAPAQFPTRKPESLTEILARVKSLLRFVIDYLEADSSDQPSGLIESLRVVNEGLDVYLAAGQGPMDELLARVLPILPIGRQIELQTAILELRQQAREVGELRREVARLRALVIHGSDSLPEAGK